MKTILLRSGLYSELETPFYGPMKTYALQEQVDRLWLGCQHEFPVGKEDAIGLALLAQLAVTRWHCQDLALAECGRLAQQPDLPDPVLHKLTRERRAEERSVRQLARDLRVHLKWLKDNPLPPEEWHVPDPPPTEAEVLFAAQSNDVHYSRARGEITQEQYEAARDTLEMSRPVHTPTPASTEMSRPDHTSASETTEVSRQAYIPASVQAEMSRPANTPAATAPTSAPPAKAPRQPGRNQPCPCGSTRKFKHCCANQPSILPPAAAAASHLVREMPITVPGFAVP